MDLLNVYDIIVLLLVAIGIHGNKGPSRPPNFLLLLADDFGFGDLSVYGHPTQEWGPIDQMAQEGMRFTQAYSAASLCTPSRAALMTGRLPFRTGMVGRSMVHLPCISRGLPHEELTIAEVLKERGYTSGMVGKWHLGTNAGSHDDGRYLPRHHGFDYVGHFLPHTLVWDCDTSKRHKRQPSTKKCFLYEDETIVQQPLYLDNMTSTFVQDAKAFIHNNQDRPFFLYVPFAQTHTPMHNMPQFKNKSKRGVYGDQVNEMAWAAGELLDTIRALGLETNTLAVFTSDHGPHREMCEEGGSAGIFKGGKGTFWEGGVRIPTIAWWPGTVSPGSHSTSVISLLDLLPTFLDLSAGRPPADRHIDGKSFAAILTNSEDDDVTSRDNHDILYFYCNSRLDAVRYKSYKIHFWTVDPIRESVLRKNCVAGGFPLQDYYYAWCYTNARPEQPPLLYDVEHDPGEVHPLDPDDHQTLLEEVRRLVTEHQQTTFRNIPDPILTPKTCKLNHIPCCNPPYCVCNVTPKF